MRRYRRIFALLPIALLVFSVSLHIAVILNGGAEQMSGNRKGFTLIELLIVVVIIGILAAIAIPKFANTKEKAYVAAMKSDLRNLATYEEQYAADNGGVYLGGIAANTTTSNQFMH